MVPSRVHEIVLGAAYAVPAGLAGWIINFDIFKIFGTVVITVLTIALLCLQLEARLRTRSKEIADADGSD